VRVWTSAGLLVCGLPVSAPHTANYQQTVHNTDLQFLRVRNCRIQLFIIVYIQQ